MKSDMAVEVNIIKDPASKEGARAERARYANKAHGVAIGIGTYLGPLWLLYLAVVLVLRLLSGGDDSDKDRWHTSGFDVATDAKTGCEYILRGSTILPRKGTRCFP